MKTLFGNKKMIVLPNGVNFNLFKPLLKEECRNILGFDQGKKHIVFFLSNPNRTEKNITLANEAIKLLNDSNIEFHVINYVEKEKVPIILNASDLLLLTSFYEGSPNIIKEAMACNTQIVSTDVGDVKDIIKNTEGCFVTSFEVEDVKNCIEKALIFNKKTNGRENIEHLDSQIIAKKLINIYKEIIN